MNKYKVNIIYGNDNLENIVVNTLIKEINRVCKNKKSVVSSTCTNLCSKKGGKQ